VSKIILSKNFIKSAVKLSLNEDLYPSGDITSELIRKNTKKKVRLISNENGIIGGLEFAKQTFNLIDKKIKLNIKKKEGSFIKKGDVIAIVEGNIKNILTGERVALNFLSHISGIATKTNQFVKKVKKNCKICCTRKTIPNFRVIQKYAVKLGGGINHRFNLSDEYLIKDNHIASSNLRILINKAIQSKTKKKITVEIDNLKQLKEILGMKFHRVLFDNMSSIDMRVAVKFLKRKYETEASGNINLKNANKISKTGVDRLSVGSLTHSVNALDLKFEI
jgi:nicotinate-nucleotide pyrophosphorylase (carboxylating)